MVTIEGTIALKPEILKTIGSDVMVCIVVDTVYTLHGKTVEDRIPVLFKTCDTNIASLQGKKVVVTGQFHTVDSNLIILASSVRLV